MPRSIQSKPKNSQFTLWVIPAHSGSPAERNERPVTTGEQLVEGPDLFCEETTRHRYFTPLRQADHRRMGAMAAAEGVIDVEAAKAGQLGCEGLVVVLLAGVETQVLQQAVAARLGLFDRLARARTRRSTRTRVSVAPHLGYTVLMILVCVVSRF